MKCLELKDVSYRYDGGTDNVLKKVNATFESGKVYAIVGQSGAGKSTLLSLISGLDACKDGDIYYKSKNLKGIDRDEYRSKNVGVIFQGYNLLLHSTPIYNITLSMHISESNIAGRKRTKCAKRTFVSEIPPGNCEAVSRHTKKAHAYSLLNKVGIDQETAERKILKLSGGEQQRVGIARALAHNPDVIIADEPTGNLDEKTEADILHIFTQLAHRDGKCVIIVTHSDHVSATADIVYQIVGGEIQSAY